MKAQFGMLLVLLTLLLPACATVPRPRRPIPVFAARNINSVAVGPVAYATYQPNAHCTVFIDEDLPNCPGARANVPRLRCVCGWQPSAAFLCDRISATTTWRLAAGRAAAVIRCGCPCLGVDRGILGT